ncbi:hypothetical protein [Paraburkholderia sp. BR14320]|uniref:hypothetical protein n=1 Tax=unclassified Paraburkholderia TaxID=2615204 RepID=UPI0034CDBC01
MKKTTTSEVTYDYQLNQYGTWGKFETPAGTVEFLETKARIGSASKDREKRLTAHLRPVREVLPTQTMDFNQLLQRDLDDHRVATGLVPYILNASKFGPAFFPPIVAALLPFEGPEPTTLFPRRAAISRTEDDVAFWEGYRFGSAFKFERMQSQLEDGGDNDIKLGRRPSSCGG